MPLGEQQKAILAHYAGVGEPHAVIVTIHSERWFTREGGGGSGYPIGVKIVYENGDVDLPRRIALPRHRHTALDKGKEVASYLRDELHITTVRLRDCR